LNVPELEPMFWQKIRLWEENLNIQVMFKILWDRCVLITVSAVSLGLCIGKPEDLQKTDELACEVLEELMKNSPIEIQQQMQDNITWIKGAQENNLVVGSQARILYADAEGRMKIAEKFNQAIKNGEIGAVVLGRDHHDVSGTDSPYRETSNIYDGSRFTADMAIQNVIGDSFRGATWVSIHNGGGVGWGEVINGGFGMLLDGSEDADRRLKSMLFGM
jgi:urocanate hydratase